MADQALLPEMLEVAMPSVAWRALDISQVVDGDDAEGANGGEGPDFGAPEIVALAVYRHGLAVHSPRQVEPLGKGIPRVERPCLARVRIGATTTAGGGPVSRISPA
jgi:hypothetical protein